jgi:PAS domain S-box-containing protein
MTPIVGKRSDDAAMPAAQVVPHDILKSPAAVALALAVTAAGYYLGAWLALALRYPSSVHSVLWPPNAIVLAALLLLPVRLWGLVLIAVFPAHVLTEAPAGWPWPTILGLFVTNTSQAVLGATLVDRLSRRYNSGGSFVVIFIAGAVFFAPFLLSFADVGILTLTGLTGDYWAAWQERFLSNAASTIIFVPPIIAAARGWRARRRPRLDRCVEAALLAACFAVLGAIVIFAKSISSSWLPLMLCTFLPLLLWAAVRFGKGGASCALLGLVAVTMGSITHWPTTTGAQEEIMMLQAFFLLVSIPVLYLAALHGDLRQYVQALDATNQRYRMATASGSVGVWEWNPQSGDLILDPQLKKLLGYEDREIANRIEAWTSHMHRDDRDRLMNLANACAGGTAPAFEDEHRMLHSDGSTRWLLSRGRLAPQAAGEPARILGTSIDVTERRRIAEELRSLEVLWSAMLASLREHIAIIDRFGVVIAVNDAWSRFAGEGTEGKFERAPIGANYLEVCRRSGDDAEAARAAAGIAAVLDGSDGGFRMEYDCSGPNALRWFEFSVIPLDRSEGGAALSHRDITRRKRAEIDAEQQRQELTHLTRVGILGQLSGALAHELNQPLTAILSNAQAVQRYLAQEPLDLPELRVALGDIVEADKRAGDVIRRLRDLLKKGEAQFRPLDLNSVIKDVLELAHSDLVVRGVTTTCRLTPDLPTVRGDRVQLQQVLLNLIANACEAMMDGEPNDRALTITTALGDNQAVQIVVADSGSGIAADMQARLFEPFVTTKMQGLGLGLPICSSIVTAHGGYMKAVNNLHGGATFSVTLPIHSNRLGANR